MSDKEFYIGWMPKAPAAFAKHTKKVVLVLFALIVMLAIALALLQKKFSTAVFEYGTLTEVKGIYFDAPVPNIKVISGKDIFGRSQYITIPVVGYGKAGATSLMKELQSARNTSFNQKEIVLKGTLLYGDGKTLLQLDKNDNPLISVDNNANADQLPKEEVLNEITIKGEIVDPKCYFGVMKPGEGKGHKDCAIRCLLGGIPPVLHVQNAKGESDYYIIAGNQQAIHEIIKEFVAEPVELKAKAVKHDDWTVLYLDGTTDVKRISKRELFYETDVVLHCAAH